MRYALVAANNKFPLLIYELRRQILHSHFRALIACLNDPELPVRVQAALALTEMVTQHEAVRDAVAPDVGPVIQCTPLCCCVC